MNRNGSSDQPHDASSSGINGTSDGKSAEPPSVPSVQRTSPLKMMVNLTEKTKFVDGALPYVGYGSERRSEDFQRLVRRWVVLVLLGFRSSMLALGPHASVLIHQKLIEPQIHTTNPLWLRQPVLYHTYLLQLSQACL